MHDLTELETAAGTLSTQEKTGTLAVSVPAPAQESIKAADEHVPAHSVLDIEPVSVGAFPQQPLGHNDDLLGEMLEGRQ